MLVKMARLGLAPPIDSWRAPTPRASIETRTPTAQVTPMTIVHTNPRRAGMPARFMRNRAQNCLARFMVSRYRPASASTTGSLAARAAGTAALTNATKTAPISPNAMTMEGMESPGMNFPA